MMIQKTKSIQMKNNRFELLRNMELKYDIKDTEYFIKLLQHDDYVIRTRATCILADFGSPDFIEPIADVLQNDPNELVRHEAAFSLGQLSFTSAIKYLQYATENDCSEFVRHEAAIALGVIGSTIAKNTLLKALKNKKDSVRQSAIIALSNIDYIEKSRNNKKFVRLTGG